MIFATDEATPLTRTLKKLVEELATAELMILVLLDIPFTLVVILLALLNIPDWEMTVEVAATPLTVVVSTLPVSVVVKVLMIFATLEVKPLTILCKVLAVLVKLLARTILEVDITPFTFEVAVFEAVVNEFVVVDVGLTVVVAIIPLMVEVSILVEVAKFTVLLLMIFELLVTPFTLIPNELTELDVVAFVTILLVATTPLTVLVKTLPVAL